jgi:hypothetical protein
MKNNEHKRTNNQNKKHNRKKKSNIHRDTANRLKQRLDNLEKIQDSCAIDSGYIDYMYSRVNPGSISCIPYLNRDHPITDVIPLALQNNLVISQLRDASNNELVNVGSEEYVLIFFTPLLTATDHASSSFSGFSIVTAAELTQDITVDAIFGYNEGGATFGGLSQVALYGSDMADIGRHGSCFSASIDLQVLAPVATRIGTYFSGHLNLGQLIDDSGERVGAVTVSELISQSNEVISDDNNIRLHQWVRNPSTLTFSEGSTTAQMTGPLLDEAVHYVIIPRMVAEIAGGQSGTASIQEYSLAGNVRSNWIVWPQISPPSKSLSRNNIKKKDVKMPKKTFEKITNLESNNFMESTMHVVAKNQSYLDTFKSYLPSSKRLQQLASIGGIISTGYKYAKPIFNVGKMLMDNKKKGVVDTTSIIFHLELDSKRFHVIDPHLNNMLKDYYDLQDDILDYCRAQGVVYNWPVPNWTPPEELVVPGNVMKTWANIERNETPLMKRSLTQPFILLQAGSKASKWYEHFMMLYTYGVPENTVSSEINVSQTISIASSKIKLFIEIITQLKRCFRDNVITTVSSTVVTKLSDLLLDLKGMENCDVLSTFFETQLPKMIQDCQDLCIFTDPQYHAIFNVVEN